MYSARRIASVTAQIVAGYVQRAVILCQLPRRQDSRGDEHHALAGLHPFRQLSKSLFIRYQLHADRGLISEIIQQRYAASDDRF